MAGAPIAPEKTTSLPVSLAFFRMGLSHPGVRTRFMGIYQAQFRGLIEAGAQVNFLEHAVPTDVDAIVTVPSPPFESNLVRLLSRTDTPLILYVPPADEWFPRFLQRQLSKRTLFAYGAHTSLQSEQRYRDLGIHYYKLPFGADPTLMRPLTIEPEYEVVFVGGLGHRAGFEAYLGPLVDRIGAQKMLLIGSGYERYGIPSQQVAYGPLLNTLYHLGKVCINLHAPRQKRGPNLQSDLNNRVFDLAMGGRPQVCDNISELRNYFSADEILGSDDPKQWVEEVLRLLESPPAERSVLAQRARVRALKEHTWATRGKQMLQWVRAALAEREARTM